VDRAGNVFIADSAHNAIKEWVAVDNSLVTLVSSGLSNPSAVALDAAGNVYIADTANGAIREWIAASNAVVTLVATNLALPAGVAVDGSGNVYIADTSHNAVKKWTAASKSVSTLVASGLSAPSGVAVDGWGNVYVADSSHNAIKELPYAFVDATNVLEGLSSGTGQLPGVVPASVNLLAPFAPTSDQSWLTITGDANGIVSFGFTANSGPARLAHLLVLGQTNLITQQRWERPRASPPSRCSPTAESSFHSQTTPAPLSPCSLPRTCRCRCPVGVWPEPPPTFPAMGSSSLSRRPRTPSLTTSWSVRHEPPPQRTVARPSESPCVQAPTSSLRGAWKL